MEQLQFKSGHLQHTCAYCAKEFKANARLPARARRICAATSSGHSSPFPPVSNSTLPLRPYSRPRGFRAKHLGARKIQKGVGEPQHAEAGAMPPTRWQVQCQCCRSLHPSSPRIPHRATSNSALSLVAIPSSTPPPAPTGRYGHTLLLRPADSSLYLFGGLDGRGRFLNDLWQFKLDPGQYECDWQELFTTQALAEQYASRDTSATTPKRRGQVPGQPSGRVGERHAASLSLPPPPPHHAVAAAFSRVFHAML
jgi:hypothetical protein